MDSLFFIMDKKIYLSIKEANSALDDKYRLEALAFCLLVKMSFISSSIKSPSIRKCKEKFHIGSCRMSRILKNGIKYGYFKKVDNNIVATRIRSHKEYNIIIERKRTYSELNKIPYTLRDIIDLIRKSVLLNHISKQSDCTDTLIQRQNPSSTKEYKRAMKRVRKLLCGTTTFYKGLSNKRISEITHTKLYRAKRLIRSLVLHDCITMNERSVKTDISPLNFNREEVNRWNKQSGKRGYFYGLNGSIYCRITNEYRYSCNLITYLF